MTLSASPADAAPIRAIAGDHPRIADVVRKLLTDHERFLGVRLAPSVVALTVRPRRLSDVAILDLAVAGHPLRLFVKVHKTSQASVDHLRRKAGIEFETLGVLHQRFATIPGYGVVRPVAFLPEESTVVTEAAEGENLHQLIKRSTPAWRPAPALDRPTAACRAAGVWLQHFQTITRQPSGRPLSIERLLAGLRDDLSACEAFGLPRSASRRLLAFAEAQTTRLEACEFPVMGQHADYQPDNILVAPATLTVLDFTGFQYGAAARDVARFLSILVFLRKNPLHSRRRLQALARAFLEGYVPLDADTVSAVALYLVLYVVKAVRTVPTWPRRWPLPSLMSRQAAVYLASWARHLARVDAALAVRTVP